MWLEPQDRRNIHFMENIEEVSIAVLKIIDF